MSILQKPNSNKFRNIKDEKNFLKHKLKFINKNKDQRFNLVFV